MERHEEKETRFFWYDKTPKNIDNGENYLKLFVIKWENEKNIYWIYT